MDNFKRRKPNAKNSGTLNGFLPNSSSLGDKGPEVKKRFRQSYKPRLSNEWESTRSIQQVDKVKSHKEGLKSINPDLGSPNNFSNTFDDAPRKSRSGMKRRKKSRSRSFRKFFIRGFAACFVALILAAGSILGYSYLTARQIFKGGGDSAAALQKNVDPAKLNGEGDGRINILLLGKGGPGHDAPDLTDTLLLASIDPVQNEAALLSVPRDMYVKDQNGNASKINAVYSNAKQARLLKGDTPADIEAAEDAGLTAIKQTVSDVVGIPVHYYVMINFEAFEDAINIVGGIDINVQEPLYDPTVAWLLGGNALVADEGLQTFDGKRALLYARSRKGSARGDFDRTERQREIIVGLQKKVLSVGTFSNPFKVVELLRTFGDNVRTDLNGIDEIKRLYEIAQDVGTDRIVSVGLADNPILVSTDFVGSQSVVRPIEGFYQYDDIHSFVRNTLKDAFLLRENSRIIIMNGTTISGLATAKEKELRSYGYNVISVENAPTSDYKTTRLIGLAASDNPYTQNYLEKRLGLISENIVIPELPTQDTADFVIILGIDESLKTTSN